MEHNSLQLLLSALYINKSCITVALAEYIFQLQAKQGFSVFLGLGRFKGFWYFWLLNLHALGKCLAQFSPGKQLPFLLIKSTTASGKMKPKLRHPSIMSSHRFLDENFGGNFFAPRLSETKQTAKRETLDSIDSKMGFQ